MSILHMIVSVIAALTMLCTSVNAAYIEFQPVQNYVIPGAHDIQYVRLNDLDLDGSSEVLAVDTDQVVLCSPALDSVLFSMPLAPNETRQVIFDDVNRDGVPDVVEGGVYSPDFRYARVTVIDGLSIWLGTPQTQMREFLIYEVMVWSSAMLGFLQAVDVNFDGKNELSFSYDTAYEESWATYSFGGHTRCYYSFPDSLLWARPQMFLGLWSLGGGSWLTSVYSGYYDDLPGMSYAFEAGLKVYDSLGGEQAGITSEVETDKKPVLSGGSTTMTYPKCVGNLITDVSGSEILASYSRSTQSGPPEFLETYTSQLRMYNYLAPDSLEIVWQLDDVCIPQNVLAHGGFSGHYLGFVGNTLNLYKAANGSIVCSTTDVPYGRRQWVYPYNNGRPYLAVMNADTVAIYSLTISTAVDEEEEVPVPRNLSMGAPRPNPFNAEQAIPISGKPNSHVTVDAYNLLGQKVARIYDGKIAGAQMTIPWKAEQLPSGVYFIRATSEGESATVKSVLLK